MIYTKKVQDAIKFSIKTHEVYQKQKRKGKDIPYVVHPLTVGLILAHAGASDDVVAAGILHDTIEDSTLEKKVTREMLAERFGVIVADLVVSVSEMQKDLSWEERKQEALSHVETFSTDSLLVKSADVLSNTRETIDDYARHGEEVFARFAVSKEKVLGHYIDMIEAIVGKWSKNPLAKDLVEAAESLRRILKV